MKLFDGVGTSSVFFYYRKFTHRFEHKLHIRPSNLEPVILQRQWDSLINPIVRDSNVNYSFTLFICNKQLVLWKIIIVALSSMKLIGVYQLYIGCWCHSRCYTLFTYIVTIPTFTYRQKDGK